MEELIKTNTKFKKSRTPFNKRKFNPKDLSGQRFGRLVAIKISGEKDSYENILWECKCDCGNSKITRGSNLRNGSTQSCGCLRLDRIRQKLTLPNNLAVKNEIYGYYKTSASRRNHCFSLTFEETISIIESPCYYCGELGSNRMSSRKGSKDYKYNGIDRKNNELGYTINNVVSCCKNCNYAKKSLSLEEFLTLILKIYKHSIQNGKNSA